jgi:hypothetical protein
MLPLSDFLGKSGNFKAEFERIVKIKDDSRENILKYISACTKIIFSEVEKNYPRHNLRYINPIFIVNKDIYPVPDVRGDINISKVARASEKLIASEDILPLSQAIISSGSPGACLFWGHAGDSNEYKGFKTLGLGSITVGLGLGAHGIDEAMMVDKMHTVDARAAVGEAEGFLGALGVRAEDRLKLVRTVVLYKNIAAALGTPMAFSFVNNSVKTHSFNCLMTFVSEHAFTEGELNDLAGVIAEMSAPIEQYYNGNNGTAPQGQKQKLEKETEKRRAAIRSAINGEVNAEQAKNATNGG